VEVRNLPKVQQGSEDLTLGLRNKTGSNLEKQAWRTGAGVWAAARVVKFAAQVNQ